MKTALLSNIFPGAILTKEEPDTTEPMLKRAPKQEVDIGFRPATVDELEAVKKARGVDSLPDGYVAGWASTVDMDQFNHIVKTGAFDESINLRGLQGPRGVKLLANHDSRKVAGAITKLETRKGNLWIEAQLNLEISYAKDLYQAAKSAGGLNFSVGFFLQRYTVVRDDDGDPTHIEIEKGDLFEVSIVPFPANENATMEFLKSLPTSEDEGPGGLPFDEPAASLSAFEKRLIEAGYANNRNEAKAHTLEVKRLVKMALAVNAPIDLFIGKSKAPAADPKSSGPSPEAIAKLAAALERANKALNP